MKKIKWHSGLIISALIILFSALQGQINKPEKGWSSLSEVHLKKVVKEIVESLTVEEKINIIGGKNNFGIEAIAKYNLRKTNYADASCGIRMRPRSTSFPCTLALAATMNTELAKIYGKSIGEECRYFGVDYLLGPGMNIYRVHQCGRNFEYLGADPYLASRMIVNYVNGLQSMGVGATLKHFVANNTDWNRCVSNSVVDERTLREIYFPAFKAGVTEAGAAAIMTSYNLLNGEYLPHSKKVITDLIRKEWGFKGFVMSDWVSVYDSQKGFDSGLDQECPVGKYFTQEKLIELIKQKPQREQELNRKVGAILLQNFSLGIYDRPEKDSSFTSNHPEVAEKVVAESIVLLKNTNKILPITYTKYKKILLIGKNLAPTSATGGGAAMYKNKKITNLSIAGSLIKTNGDKIEYIGFNQNSKKLMAFKKEEIKNLAKEVDLVIVGIGTDHQIEKEGADAPFALPKDQYDLVKLAFENNKNTVVLSVSGRGLDMSPFADQVPAILQIFFPGEHGGEIVAAVLSGELNPSGKLPFTLGRSNRDHHYYENYRPKGAVFYPEARYNLNPKKKVWNLKYQEGIFLDYRWFDKKQIKPLFPFGAGLSYSTFEYNDLKIKKIGKGLAEVSVKIKNKGPYSGKEVVQCYVQDIKSSEERPVKELKGFVKIFLKVNESKTIKFRLSDSAFSFFNSREKKWIVEKGKFLIHVGRSVSDIRQKCEYIITN